MRPTASPTVSGRVLRFAQWTCFVLGSFMCSGYAAALIAAEFGRRSGIEAFEGTNGFESAPTPDFSLWSQTRINKFLASMHASVGEPMGILRARSLDLAVPLYAEPSELHLNRGVALIPGMSTPDHGGNVGIAGHRDGFFRVLKDMRPGAVIELQTRARLHRYRVVAIDIVDAADRDLLKDTEEPTLTLVTCYPFYHVGHAPQRFVVRGEYLWGESQTITQL